MRPLENALETGATACTEESPRLTPAARALSKTRRRASGMGSTPEPLVLADQKAGEARELIAKGSYDPAIELLASALELRCMPALSCPGPHKPASLS